MTFALSLDEGTYLVRLARRAIETNLLSGEVVEAEEVPDKLRQLCGVFVTLNKFKGSIRSLRGCIGLPYPTKPLVDAVVDAAISSATNDPRFNPVSSEEMNSIIIEVSVLTPPETINVDRPDRYLDHIEVGRDGLIISRGGHRGLLLPQVPVDQGWDVEDFLTNCCLKAWLPPDSWLDPQTKIEKFQANIFEEEAPGGSVIRAELDRR